MQGSVVTNLLLPGSLGLIMFGLGLSLTVADFSRVVRMPKAVLVGLFAQTFVLTSLCAVICKLLGLSPSLAIGMMLLAAAPGGASANIFSHLARGDLALNITLTAINSALALVTLPIIVSLSFALFQSADQSVPPPFGKIIETSIFIILPVAVGMLVRRRAPSLAMRAEKPVRVISVVVLAALSVIAIAANASLLMANAAQVGLACVLFNVLSMAIGYALPRFTGLSTAQSIAISMEIGIHNATLAIYIALNVLGDGAYAVPAAVYSFVMFVTAAVFTWWLTRRPVT